MTQAQVDQQGFFKKIDIELDESYLVRVESGPSIGIFHKTSAGVRGVRLTPERWAHLKEMTEAIDLSVSLVGKKGGANQSTSQSCGSSSC